MRILLSMFLLCVASFVHGNETSSFIKNEDSKVCQGHRLTKKFWNDFQMAKTSKERWDEETPYDRSIKECKSEMYKDENKWVIECYWTHVDNCPKCDNYVVMEVSNKE